MLIEVDAIKDQGLTRQASESHEHFPVLDELHGQGEVRFEKPLDIRVAVRRLDEMIVVEGEVETAVRFQCCRCLEGFCQQLRVEFAVTYVRHTHTVVEDEAEGEVELQAEDLGLVPFEGDEIDLSEAIQEQVIMALPIKPLCKEGCRGLCAHCGANLNEGDCGCHVQDFGGKFAALKDFKVRKKD